MKQNDLQVVPQKPESVVLTNKWVYRDPVFEIGDQQVQVNRAIRYLGGQPDSKLNLGATCGHCSSQTDGGCPRVVDAKNPETIILHGNVADVVNAQQITSKGVPFFE